MMNNWFKKHFPFFYRLRAARQLAARRIQLEHKHAALKARYKAGNYSGHPEEMLEEIEGVYLRIKSLKASSSKTNR